MRKLNFALVAVAALIISVFSFSCRPKDTYVSIQLDPSDSVVNLGPGQTYQVKVTLSPDAVNKGKVGEFKITVNSNDVVDTTYDSKSSVSYDFSYTVPEDAQIGSNITISFSATDARSGNTTIENVTINVISLSPEITKQTGITASFTSTNYENSEFIAQFNADGVNLVGEPQNGTGNNGDMTFVYQGSTYGNCILSPNNSYPDAYGEYNGQDYYYGSKNQTLFKKVTGLDFDNLTAEAIDSLDVTENEAGTIGSYGYGYKLVNEGDMFVFKTQDGRKGVLRVVELSNPNPGKNDTKLTATMKFDVIYQLPSASTK